MRTTILMAATLLAAAMGIPALAKDDVARTIIATERAGLYASDRGDVSMFLKLSAPDVVYTDPFIEKPIIGIDALTAYYATMFKPDDNPAVTGEMQNERVQVMGDTAVLSFNYVARNVDTKAVVHRWNAVEVYNKRDGEWRIVNTHWSFVKPPPKAKAEDPTQAIVAMEKAALDRWIHGDPSGFLEISAPDVVYFDPVLDKRMDGLEALTAHYEAVRGKLRAERFELIDPKVQSTDNMAVLTFNYVSWGKSGKASRWNCTEVYRHDPAGWRIIQTHWSATNLPKQWDERKKEWLKKQQSSN